MIARSNVLTTHDFAPESQHLNQQLQEQPQQQHSNINKQINPNEFE